MLSWNDQGIGRFTLSAMYLEEPQAFLCLFVSIPTIYIYIYTSICIHSRSCKHTPMHIYTFFHSGDVRIWVEKLDTVTKKHQITLYQLFPATGGGGGWVGGGGVIMFLLLRVDRIVLSRRCAHVLEISADALVATLCTCSCNFCRRSCCHAVYMFL